MAVIIGRVTQLDTSNMTIEGKVIFVPPEKRTSAWVNFPVGTVAKVTVDKGTATLITSPSPEELAGYTRNELPGNNKAPVKAANPSPPPAAPQPTTEAIKTATVPLQQANGSRVEYVTVRADSLEFGTPSKGGVIKVYVDVGDPVDAERRIREAFRLRQIAQGLAEGAAV